jgi:ABC-type multidrug transport system ATPase subunit
MLVAQPADSVNQRLSEIHQFVIGGDVNHAIKRLMDYSREFSSDRDVQNESVTLSARFNMLRRDKRRLGTSDETDRRDNELISSVLALADQIHDDFLKRTGVLGTRSDASVRQLALVPPPAPPAPAADNEELAAVAGPQPASQWEQSRTRFLEHRRSDPSAPLDASAAVYRCRGLRKQYRGSTGFLLRDLNLDLLPGQITGLVGVNGSGKTTLLQIVAGVLSSTAGEVAYPAISGGRLDWARIRNAIGCVQQQPAKWYGRLADNLHLTAASHGLTGRANEDEVEFVLYRLGLDEYRHSTWSEISGGYKMRFELARALVKQPALLVLDEPLAPLDIVTQQLFLQDLRDLADSKRRPLPVIVSSQHLYEIETVADTLLFLEDGKALFHGRLDDVGKDADENLFEVTCVGSRSHVEVALGSFDGFGLDVFGKVFVVRVSKTVSAAELLRALLSHGVEIRHFRDISHSTRRLFETKGELI